MKRAEINPMPEYFDRYINMVDNVELLEAIDISIAELDAAPVETWRQLGEAVYAPGKWTVRDILQHLIDTERIFSFRALSFARAEKQLMPAFSEDDYAREARAGNRTPENLIRELRTSHLSLRYLYESFTPEMLAKKGMGFKGEYSVNDIGFLLPGHQRWHFRTLEEKYYPLLNENQLATRAL